jgi:hypothetical protein
MVKLVDLMIFSIRVEIRFFVSDRSPFIHRKGYRLQPRVLRMIVKDGKVSSVIIDCLRILKSGEYGSTGVEVGANNWNFADNTVPFWIQEMKDKAEAEVASRGWIA